MDPKTRAMLNEAEQALLRETDERDLAKLDEDELIELHRRIRRARTKYVKLHRRRGAAQVRKDRSRTRAGKAVRKTAIKAEAFEEALAVVSARLAKVAADAAEALKQERLAAARKGTKRKRKPTPGQGKVEGKGGDGRRARRRSPIEEKRTASDRAAKRRSQAKRAAKG